MKRLIEPLFYLVYDAALVLGLPLILLGLFLRYPKTFLDSFFDGLPSRLGLKKPNVPRGFRPLWIHAASLGECRAALPLVRAIKKKHPGQTIAFSCTTPNGIQEA